MPTGTVSVQASATVDGEPVSRLARRAVRGSLLRLTDRTMARSNRPGHLRVLAAPDGRAASGVHRPSLTTGRFAGAAAGDLPDAPPAGGRASACLGRSPPLCSRRRHVRRESGPSARRDPDPHRRRAAAGPVVVRDERHVARRGGRAVLALAVRPGVGAGVADLRAATITRPRPRGAGSEASMRRSDTSPPSPAASLSTDSRANTSGPALDGDAARGRRRCGGPDP